MAQLQNKRRSPVIYYVLTASFLLRAFLYISAGAWIWGVGFALLAAVSAYSAYQASVTQQEVKAAWEAHGSGRTAPANDGYFKKCPDCGKFTRGANVCRNCGHDLDYPPTRPAKGTAESDS